MHTKDARHAGEGAQRLEFVADGHVPSDAYRRGGYRDRESRSFIESWFGKLKEREVWLNEYETVDQARRGIGGYVDRYHHRPHSGLDYRTPDEVRRTWEDGQPLLKTAA